jgi:hypothetical protein
MEATGIVAFTWNLSMCIAMDGPVIGKKIFIVSP